MKRAADPNAWMDKMPSAEFPGAIRQVFDFLCRDYSFHEPMIAQTSLSLRLSYRANHVAVEVDVDFRDRAVEVALVWLLDGKRPDGWKIDSSGRQFMIRLFEAAWHRKVSNPRVAIPPDSSPQSILQLQLEAWAEQLRVHFGDVLADSDSLFLELDRQKRHKGGEHDVF